MLTHRVRDKIPTYSNVISWKKTYEYRLRFPNGEIWVIMRRRYPQNAGVLVVLVLTGLNNSIGPIAPKWPSVNRIYGPKLPAKLVCLQIRATHFPAPIRRSLCVSLLILKGDIITKWLDYEGRCGGPDQPREIWWRSGSRNPVISAGAGPDQPREIWWSGSRNPVILFLSRDVHLF